MEKVSIDKVFDILKQNELYHHVSVTKHNNFTYEKNPSTESKAQSTVDTFQIKCSPQVSTDKAKNAKETFKKFFNQVEFSQELHKGEKMPEYKGFKKVFSDQDADLIHKQGEVLLVDVWATWCGPCQNPMKHNQEMLEKNEEKWKGKARIVAVSVDDDKQVIQNRVNTKGWTKIEHLTMLGWHKQHPLIQNFDITGIPFVFLVDKDGLINFTGHPSEANLQERINQLISKPEYKNQEPKMLQQNQAQSLAESIQKIESIDKFLSKEKFDEKFEKTDFFKVNIERKFELVKGSLKEFKINAKVTTWEDQAHLVEEFKKLVKQSNCQLNVQADLIKSQQIPEPGGVACSNCQNPVQYPLYWCRWEPNPNSFRCRQCVQSNLNEEGKHYKYTQNSILLTSPWKRLSPNTFGQNIQPQDLTKVTQPNAFLCNLCDYEPEKIGQPRYICLVCQSLDPKERGDLYDICQGCVDKICKKDQELIEQIKEEGHDPSHPLLRILYNVKGYWDY